ncbi:hypothetical protein D3C75_1156890 [compost metagenome]
MAAFSVEISSTTFWLDSWTAPFIRIMLDNSAFSQQASVSISVSSFFVCAAKDMASHLFFDIQLSTS